jgi:hypothetical protein
VTCGPGVDSVHADQRGIDSIFSDCETTDFAPFLPPPGGPTGTEPADTVAPVLDQLTPTPRHPIARDVAGNSSRRRTASFTIVR